uniref:EF-hand domain-containing protein n=1 Tax=Panagrellus redivivus TaxID=6233 RepID=A0A7E4W076_PANRE
MARIFIMFTGKSVYVTRTTTGNKTSVQQRDRRQSEYERTIHRVFGPPHALFVNRTLDQLWVRLYWCLRNAQFKIFYKDDETDIDVSDLVNYEQPEKPPPLASLVARTNLPPEWIKYMYSRFKSECPSGRMNFADFKRVMGFIAPERISDAYLERVFRAMCYSSFSRDRLTFKDFMEAASLISEPNPRAMAQWSMRLIHPRTGDRITPAELAEFIKCIFLLSKNYTYGCVRRESSLPEPPVPNDIIKAAWARAKKLFIEIDIRQKGYLTVSDLERYIAKTDNGAFIMGDTV